MISTSLFFYSLVYSQKQEKVYDSSVAAMAMMIRMLIFLALGFSHALETSHVTITKNAVDITEHDWNDEGAPKNELRVVTTQHNSLDLTQNNNDDNTCPARNDEEVLENEPTMATTQQNSLDLTQNNNRDNTNPARNDEEVLENEPTMATLSLSMIGASAGPRVPRQYPRPPVIGEFPGHRRIPHVTGELPQYRTGSRRGISRTASHPGIFTPHKAARVVGKALLWYGALVVGGFISTLQVKEFVFSALICLCVIIRINYPNHILFPSTCVVSVVLSATRLASQHFSETEDAYKATRNLAFNVFYIMAFIDALGNSASIACYYLSDWVI